MTKNILILSGSPKKNGNTAALVEWFMEGAGSKNAKIEVIHAAFLQYKFPGCTSCRACQKQEAYECVIDDDANLALRKMAAADVIVMATPLYFFAASAQLKVLIDRMFALYKWDNAAGTMRTVLKGKTLLLLGSAYEDVGLDAMEKPFMLTADYSGMEYGSLLATNAGESGDIRRRSDIREKAVAFGQQYA
jgi:multimeric flavodoxin WrbA